MSIDSIDGGLRLARLGPTGEGSNMNRVLRAAGAAALVLPSLTAAQMPGNTSGAAAPAADPDTMTPDQLRAWKKANGSWYVQCDGDPDNVTGAETAARLLGAVTLLGVFAPAHESADPAKRKFGAEGVAACTRLIEGPQRESSASRRLGLVLGRALHRIEAKDYAGAIADTALARTTAKEAGIVDDVYWQTSRGRAPDLIESAALYRMGRIDEASALGFKGQADFRYALMPLLRVPGYYGDRAQLVTGELDHATALTHAHAFAASVQADRLEELGRFGEAATLRVAIADLAIAMSPKKYSATLLARAAVTHALAGQRDAAEKLAKEAQAQFDAKRTGGTPEANSAAFVEEMDLLAVIRAADAGDAKSARRLFAARSQWPEASFGSVVEVSRRLHVGAAQDELIGGLAKTPAELWKARADDRLAAVLATDANNASLFALVPAATSAKEYEALSKQAWKVEKSSWLLKDKKPDPENNGFETLFAYGQSPASVLPAYMLHAALLAKSRGQHGFVVTPLITSGLVAARIKTGNLGDPGLAAPLFNDADAVIAALSPMIPSPETLKARAKTG